jgi:non-specific serine/threonine protein kinase
VLTLTGAGGVGKTRLAAHLAQTLAPDFRDGVAFVSLAPIVDPAMAGDVIARALGASDTREQRGLERVLHALWGKQLLLVLDSFEQIATAAPDISEILGDCPDVKVLVTSRIPLHIGGEQEYAVPPFELPHIGSAKLAELSENPAVALFVQRARAVKADFALTGANAEAVAEICRRLDGLPLAIELAAARSKVLAPTALLARLAGGLDLLSGGPRDQPSRHQTLRAAIAWSFDLLTEDERRCFSRLSIFSGGFTLEAAEAVVGLEARPGAAFEGIAALVDCSLLWTREGSDGETRFFMLKTVREFGLELLRESGDFVDVAQRHAEYCLTLVRRAEPAIMGGRDQASWFNRLAAEHENLRAALRWSEQAQDAELALALANGLYWFWYVRGHLSEGRHWYRVALALGNQAPSSARAQALLSAGKMAHWQAEDTRANELLTAGHEMAQQISDLVNVRLATGLFGTLAEDSGDYDRAARLYQEALGLFSESDTEAQVLALKAITRAHLGVAFWGQGRFDLANQTWREALDQHRALDDSWGVANVLGYLALVACEQGELERAARHQHESLTAFRDAESVEDIAAGVATTAAIAGLRGEHALAARLFGAADAMREAIGCTLALPERLILDRVQTTVQSALSDKTFQAAQAAGKSLSASEAVAEALGVLAEVSREHAPVRSTSGLDLTPREQDVLRLLVTGRTDREIADALFISPRTAQGHVARLFDKLGVSTRTAAVAAALHADILRDQSTD